MANRKINFDYPFGSSEGTDKSSALTPIKSEASSASESLSGSTPAVEFRSDADGSGEVAPVTNAKILPPPPAEPVNTASKRSVGRKGRKTKEGTARDSGVHHHISVSSDVFLLLSRCKNMWALSENRLGTISNNDFLRLVLEEFSNSRKFV